MLTLLLTLALSSLLMQENEPERSSPEEVLEELIESSNELSSFQVVYSMRRGGEESGELAIDYSAPDQICMRTTSPKGDTHVAIANDKLWTSMSGSEQGDAFGLVDLQDRGGDFEAALALQRELFPRVETTPSVTLRVDWGVDPEAKEQELDVQVAFVRTSRSRLLGWLGSMQNLDGELSLEGDALIYDGPTVRVSVDRHTGFLTELDAPGMSDEPISIRLKNLDLQNEPVASVFSAPSPPEGARDISADLHRNLFRPVAIRRELLVHVDRLLASEAREWDASFEADVRRLHEAFHLPVLERSLGSWMEQVRATTAELGSVIHREREAGRERAELERAIAERRAGLVGGLASTRGQVLARSPAAPERTEPSEHWETVLELERETIGVLFDRHVGDILLAEFDEETAIALGD